jgi:2'-5' RNA ligase
MRTFIAIELSEEIKDFLSRIQNQLRSTGADVKWVQPQNIHLTLKFLGERDDKKIEKIIQILEDAVKEIRQFSIRLSSIGAFPRITSPRVIWIGVSDGDTETKVVAEELEKNLAKIGIPKEDRPFSSHITIGRTRSGLNREVLVKELENLTDKFGEEKLEFLVNKITLFESTLTPKGPIYEVLKEASLMAI